MASPFLAGFPGGLIQGLDAGTQQALRELALQQAQQQQQGLGLGYKAAAALGGIPQMPQGPTGYQQGVAQDITSSLAGGMPQPQTFGGGLASSLPAPGAVKGSWFGNAPGWSDPSDSGLQASGQPVSAGPGIALPSRSTLGQEFDVTAPSGQTMTLPQTDVGPAKWTGRGVDINAPAAEAMGYTPQTFPTDQQFIVKAHNQLDGVVGQKGAQLIQAGVPVPAAQASTQTAKAAGREIDPSQWGMASLHQMTQAIDKVAPDAPDAVKMIALGQLNKLVAPEERMMLQLYMKENAQQIQLGLKELQLTAGRERLAESERHNLVMEGIAGGRLGQAGEKTPPATQAYDAYMKAHPHATPEQRQQFILSGKPPRSAAAQSLRMFIEEYTAEHGKPPSSEELRNFQAGTAEAVTEGRVTGTRAASLDQAGEVLDAMIPLLKDASTAVDRTNYPTINKLILAYQEGTGDTNVVKYGEMINEIRYLYARALSPTGQARVADLQHFDEVMNRAWSQGQINAGLDQIKKSIAVERDVIKKRREEIRGPGAAPTAGASPQPGYTAPNAPQPGTVEDGFVFQGGDPSDPKSWKPQ